MADRFVEVSRQGWFSRIGGSLVGILVGIVLVPVSMGLLFWNEGRSVKTYRSLKEGAGQVQTVAAEPLAAGHEGKLVHVTGMATTSETLQDDETGIGAAALRLERKVEMYQWKESSRSEKKTRTGGSTETVTTYEYSKEWADHPISSESFKQADGHANPSSWPLRGATFSAERVTLGAFVLGDALKSQIGGAKPMPIDGVPPGLAANPAARNHQGVVYLAKDPNAPAVGDVRISYQVTEPATVSVVARQTGDTLVPHATSAGVDVALLEMGTRSAAEMFQAAQRRNTMVAWLLRCGGFVVMAVGFGMVFRPVRVLADVLPFMGRLVGLATGFTALLLAAMFSSGTIAFAWIAYRPLLAIALLAVAGMAAVAAVVVVVKRRQAPAPAAAAA